MDDDSDIKPSFSTRRRWSQRLKLIVDLFCVVALIAMANYFGARHYSRGHLTADTRHELSSQTRLILQALTNDVRITVFFDRNQALYHDVTELVSEYRLLTPKIEVSTIDYNSNVSGAEIVKKRLKLAPGMVNDMIIFESNGQTKIVQTSELSGLDMSNLISGKSQEVKRINFKGELLFTSAIANVSFGDTPKAYFLEGHGEHNPERAIAHSGYSKFTELLKLNNVDSARLNLMTAIKVPDDCAMMIIAGPERPAFHPRELAFLRGYLEQNGRLLLLFKFQTETEIQTGLEQMMREWGVDVGNNTVFDPEMSRSGLGILVTNFTSHGVIRPLQQSYLHMALPRSVGRLESASQAADAPQVQELALTSVNGEARGEFNLATGQIRPNPFKDKVGVAIPLMAAVESGKIEGVLGSTRMLIIGGSKIFDNEMIESAANRDFAVSSINWLLDRSYLVGGIGPRKVEEHKWVLTPGQLRAANITLIGIIPGAILGFGILVWFRRRR